MTAGSHQRCLCSRELFVRGSFGHSPAVQADTLVGWTTPKPLGLTKSPQNVLSLAWHLQQLRFSIITAGI